MGKKLPLDFQFPLKGLDRGTAYRTQPPLTSPDLKNVRAFESAEGRARGGQRPGLGKVFPEELGSGNPVRLIGQVSYMEGTAGTTQSFSWMDLFRRDGDDLGGGWATASWVAVTCETEFGYQDVGYAFVESGVEAGNVRDALGFAIAYDYRIRVIIPALRVEGQYKFRIYARMDNSSPDATDEGVIAELIIDENNGDHDYSGTLKDYDSGSLQDSWAFSEDTKSDDPGWYNFDLLISGNTVSVEYDGVELTSQTVTAHSSQRVGFGLHYVSGAYTEPYRPSIARFQVTGTQVVGPSSLPFRRTCLVASANGEVRAEKTAGNMSVVSGNPADLSTNHLIHATERGMKLYIADYGGYKVSGTDGTIAGGGQDELDAASVPDWTTHSIDVNNDVAVLYDSNPASMDGTYQITSVVTAKVTLATGAGATGTCSFYIARAPKVYDPAADTMAIWAATAGEVPTGCPLIALYQDRMVLGGHEMYPHEVYFSKQDAPLNFDYTDTTAQRATRGGLEVAGRLGRIISAMMPFVDDFLIFAGPNSLWVLRGDPTFGGRIGFLSQNVGCIDKGAWAFGPDGELYMLDTAGLYRLVPNPAGHIPPEPLSLGRLPRELRGIDVTTTTVLLGWNEQENGVDIFITPETANPATHWFYDIRLDAFDKDSNVAAHGPTAAWTYKAAVPTERTLLLGGRDGYIRGYDLGAKDDDGQAIDSYAVYGPILLAGDERREGVLLELDAVLANGSDDVDWELRVGRTAQQAVDAAAFASGTWSGDGLQHRVRPRARGCWVVIKVGNNRGGESWGMESLRGVSREAGRVRVP